jgi:hypothetical protein
MLIVVDLSILHLNFSGLGFMWDYSSLGLEMGLNSIRKSESVLKTLRIWAFWGFGFLDFGKIDNFCRKFDFC